MTHLAPALTLSSYPRDLPQPTCCTRYLSYSVRDYIDTGILTGLTVLLAGLHGLFLLNVPGLDLFSGRLEFLRGLWLYRRDSLRGFVGAHRRGQRRKDACRSTHVIHHVVQ